jgi:hypothetical protein
MRRLHNWNQFYTYLTEAVGGIKTRSGDPFEYKVVGGHWLSRRKGSTKWYEITGKDFKDPYQKSINILDTEFPDEREDGSPKKVITRSQAWRTPAGTSKEQDTTPTTTKEATTTSSTTTKKSTTEMPPEGPVREEPKSPVLNRQFDLPLKDGIPTFDGAKSPTRDPLPDDESLKNKFIEVVGQEVAKKFEEDCNSIGLPYIIALRQIYTESNFKPYAESGAGAVGICQFMPGTWQHYGGQGSRTNPEESLRIYIKMMNNLLNRFPKRLDLAVAGYNSGPNLNIYKRALDQGTPFAQIQNRLSRETRNYANRIFA